MALSSDECVSNCGASEVTPCAIVRTREMLRGRRCFIWSVRARWWSEWGSRCSRRRSPRRRCRPVRRRRNGWARSTSRPRAARRCRRSSSAPWRCSTRSGSARRSRPSTPSPRPIRPVASPTGARLSPGSGIRWRAHRFRAESPRARPPSRARRPPAPRPSASRTTSLPSPPFMPMPTRSITRRAPSHTRRRWRRSRRSIPTTARPRSSTRCPSTPR